MAEDFAENGAYKFNQILETKSLLKEIFLATNDSQQFLLVKYFLNSPPNNFHSQI